MHPSARDLLHANPVLLWLLAERCLETAGWREQAAELLELPQRAPLAKILDRAEADVRPAQVDFLRKLVVIGGRRGDERIALRARIGSMQSRALPHDCDIDREYAVGEGQHDSPVQPGAQNLGLPGIASLHQQHAQFQFQHRNDR